jgi:small subunit ribosomal protein S16
MLKIRLSRIGKRNQPHYRVVVVEARSKRDGKVTEVIGSYNPNANPKQIVIDHQKYSSWLEKGAQPTAVVSNLVQKTLSHSTN